VVDNRQASLPVTIVSNKISQIRKCYAIFFDFYFPPGTKKALATGNPADRARCFALIGDLNRGENQLSDCASIVIAKT
jgi:hypothetical protein